MIIVDQLKDFLRPQLEGLSKIDAKVTIEVIYSHTGSNWDTDNKAGLWAKVFADLIKKEVLKDDSVKYLGDWELRSDPGAESHRLVFNIKQYEKQF